MLMALAVDLVEAECGRQRIGGLVEERRTLQRDLTGSKKPFQCVSVPAHGACSKITYRASPPAGHRSVWITPP